MHIFLYIHRNSDVLNLQKFILRIHCSSGIFRKMMTQTRMVKATIKNITVLSYKTYKILNTSFRDVYIIIISRLHTICISIEVHTYMLTYAPLLQCTVLHIYQKTYLYKEAETCGK